MTTMPSAVRTRASPVAGRKIVAIASGKGGVGKTWLAITLAHALAQGGGRALLFDGDLGLANVDIQLGLMPKQDLGSVIAGRLSLREAACPYPEGGFDIISGRSGSGSLAGLPRNSLRALGDDLMALAKEYDHVIVDLGAGVEQTVRSLTGRAGTCLVVTTDEPTALTDAYAFIKVTVGERPDTDLRIVVNMAHSALEGERTYATLLRACEGFLKISPPLAGIVRHDSRVRDSIRNQVPLLTRYPTSAAAADIAAIAGKLVDEE